MEKQQTPPSSSSTPATKNGEDDNSWSYSYNFDDYCETTHYGTLAVLNMAITILGLTSCLFLLIIIMKNPRLRQDKYIFHNQLIIASFYLLFVSGILYVEDALNPCWNAGAFLCRAVNFLKTCLINSSTLFLIVLSIQQLNRYRQRNVTVFNATHTRCLLVTVSIWILAMIISVPEFVFASVLWFSSRFAICELYQAHIRHNVLLSAKLLFLEYIAPLIILAVVTVTTGIYIFVNKSRYSTWGTTTGESLVPLDRDHPRYFSFVGSLTVVFMIGYFPIYSFELVSMLVRTTNHNQYAVFWWHMETISTFFVLLPPALIPLLTLMLSWEHFDILKSIFQHLTVPENSEESLDQINTNAEQPTNNKDLHADNVNQPTNSKDLQEFA